MPPSEPVRVLIADGHGLVRAGLRLLLERHDGVVVAAEAGTCDAAVAAARTTAPDVVKVPVFELKSSIAKPDTIGYCVPIVATCFPHVT